MSAALRRTARIALGALLAACAAEESAPVPEAVGPVPVAIRLTLDGDTGVALGPDGAGQIVLGREDGDEPVRLAYENGALAVQDLVPGRYEVASLGALPCRGLAFDVADRPRYLGAVRVTLVRAAYDVALVSRPDVAPADVAELADRAGAPAQAVDARPLAATESAPCFLGPDGPVTTWEDLTLGEKIILSVGVAGLCAVSLAAGGFCHF